jgi:hypothetical protein
MSTTTAAAIANALRTIFSKYGLPESIVSDNGPPFQSAEYERFLKLNRIQRILVAPYHPSSNGQAERFVQTFKNFMKTSSSNNSVQLHPKIQNFLLTYRSTPHATTHVSPAKLFLNREVRTRLSLIKPDLARTVATEQSKMKNYFDQRTKCREFAAGDQVLAKDFTSTEKWQPAEVLQHKAPHSYSVQLKDGRVWTRHVDHLVRGASLPAEESSSQSRPDAGGQQPAYPKPPEKTGTENENSIDVPVTTKSGQSSSQSRPDAGDQQPAYPIQPSEKPGTDNGSSIDASVTTRSGRIIKMPSRYKK